MTTEFTPFPKIPRLNRDATITEKIDGTNASIHISEDGSLRTASRTRWVTPADDNQGFAAWAYERQVDLIADLGPGAHFGEWWGKGIQRHYGLDHRRFSLFNVSRWGSGDLTPRHCHVVPVLYRGLFDTAAAHDRLARLRGGGSIAAPGFPRPEGIIIYHAAGNNLYKMTIEKDDEHKSKHKATV